MHLRIQITGESGDGKTRTALTSRGKIGAIDHGADDWLYLHKTPDGFDPNWAVMTEDFSPAKLTKGDLALWMAPDPTVATKENIINFAGAAGLGRGDTFLHDAGSLVWDWSLEASDIQFGQKGMKPDFQAMKRPVSKVNWAYRQLPCDIVQTARAKYEWSKEDNKPTGKIIAGGERAASPYLFHFEFRMDVEGEPPKHVAICTKQRGGFFKAGERMPWPNLAEIFSERGIYALLDGVHEPEAPDSEETLNEKAEEFLGLRTSEASETDRDALVAECREAFASGKLAEWRKDRAVKVRCGKLSPAHLAELKAVIKDMDALATKG